MAKTYRRILIFIVILGVLMGLLGKKFAGDQYVNTEPRKNTECTLQRECLMMQMFLPMKRRRIWRR